MSYKILLVEDETPIAESVAYSLKNEGFDVEMALDGLAAVSIYRSFVPDLIILDLMLPKLSGLDFCRLVRKESTTPIVMLTAKTEEIDRVVGLELGADDYVPKPFSMRELIARVRAVLRRTEAADYDSQTRLQVADIDVDVVRRRVSVGGQPVHLPLKQFELIRLLLLNKDKVVSREELLRSVWGEDADKDNGTLDVHIRWLREKLEADPSHPEKIRTVRGVGYKIVSDAQS